MPSNLRQNPFTRAFAWQAITGEAHSVAQYAHLPGLYGILLKEIPRPNSLSITFTDTMQKAVIVTSDPLANQARIDYQRGHVLFNIADNGRAMTVSYQGGGTNLNLENLKVIIQTQTASS